MVGLLTFKGECSTKKGTPDIRSPEVDISAFLCSKLITLSFCQLYRIVSEPPRYKYMYSGNFPVSLANVQK